MSHDLPASGLTWADRLSPTARAIAMGFSALFLLFAGGTLAGFVFAMLEDSRPTKPLAWAVLAVILVVFVLLAMLLVRLGRSWQSARLSAFDRRYYRMWAIILGIGALIGLSFALLDGKSALSVSSLASSSPVDPALALVFSTVLLVAFLLIMILYHRRIDDYEERAYLWASHVAFHFLAAALPAAWLLGRGGWIAPLGGLVVFTLLFASILIQMIVWLWLKFR